LPHTTLNSLQIKFVVNTGVLYKSMYYVVRGSAEPMAICAGIMFREGGLPAKLSVSLTT
jgi:hypothetical protein